MRDYIAARVDEVTVITPEVLDPLNLLYVTRRLTRFGVSGIASNLRIGLISPSAESYEINLTRRSVQLKNSVVKNDETTAPREKPR